MLQHFGIGCVREELYKDREANFGREIVFQTDIARILRICREEMSLLINSSILGNIRGAEGKEQVCE